MNEVIEHPPEATQTDWQVFTGGAAADSHRRLINLAIPPWRTSQPITAPEEFTPAEMLRDRRKAAPFVPDPQMVWAVNASLYLRRPLLLTGKPGAGKSSLISRVATELSMGPVLRWDINSRSTVRSGIYEYDAIGRLQSSRGETTPPIEDYLTLNALGTAMLGTTWPRALLIDEIDKGDLDLANDLLNVIEEGTYEIPELRRLKQSTVEIRDGFGKPAEIVDGLLQCTQFPFVVMTSNAEREFPPAFLRRCIRLTITPPTDVESLALIVKSHLKDSLQGHEEQAMQLVEVFADSARQSELATDQLLNAVFLAIGIQGESSATLGEEEMKNLRKILLEKLV